MIGSLTRLHSAAPPQATRPDPPEAQTVALGAGVQATIDRYAKAVRYDLIAADLDHRLHGTYGRLPAQLVKVAANVAAMDWATGIVKTPVVTIELPHMAWSMEVVEDWRASAHRVLARSEETEQDRLRRRVNSVWFSVTCLTAQACVISRRPCRNSKRRSLKPRSLNL